mgnify:CR=1 FL=1
MRPKTFPRPKVAPEACVLGCGHRVRVCDCINTAQPVSESRQTGIIWHAVAVDPNLRNALKHLQIYAKVTHLSDSASTLSSKALIIASALLVLPPAFAADPAACRTTMQRLSEERSLDAIDPDSKTVTLEVGGFEAQLGEDPAAAMTGGILIRQGDKLAGADSARYDPATRTLLLDGGVRYEDSDTQVESDAAESSYNFGRIRFEGAEFLLGASDAHGSADAIEINQRGRLELDAVSYTTCPPESNDWLLEAASIDLDTRSGVGTARGLKLRFQGIPILYSPYLSFPISDARKSGILNKGSDHREQRQQRYFPWQRSFRCLTEGSIPRPR